MSVQNNSIASLSRKRPAPDDDGGPVEMPTKVLKVAPAPELSTNSPLQKPLLPMPISSAVAAPAAVTGPVAGPIAGALGLLAPGPLAGSTAASVAQIHSVASTPQNCGSKEETGGELAEKDTAKAAKLKEREEKKRKKDEENQRKKLEREVKLKAKEEEKRVKMEEKRAKEEEKRAKEEEKRLQEEKTARGQLRVNAFFKRLNTAFEGTFGEGVRSASPVNSTHTKTKSDSPAKSTEKDSRSEYERTFLPFNVPSHTKLAPINYFLTRGQNPGLYLHLKDFSRSFDLDLPSGQRISVKEVFGPPVPRGHPVLPVKEIMDLFQGSSGSKPVESSMGDFKTNQELAMDQLKGTQMKYIHFDGDVRPPYFGTYTKPLMPLEWKRLCRNPCGFKMKMYDYDYDSEAEWEDDVEDGEDVMSNGEEEDEEDGDEDMEDFLDDEGLPAGQGPKRYVAGELNPRCTGLHWQDGSGKLHPADPSSQPVDFAELEMVFLLPQAPTTINPFDTTYWEPRVTKTAPASAVRQQLFKRPALIDKTKTVNAMNATVAQVPKAGKLVPAEDLDAFKLAIEGSDMTKIAMVEHLKKLFPKINKSAITDTLGMVAERTGKTRTDKWRLKN